MPAPGLGQDNDAYIDLATGLEYQKAGGVWGQIIQPTLPATKITGQIVDAQIQSVAGSKITGTIPHGALPAINIDTDTTGQLPYSRLSGAPKATRSALSGGPPASPADLDIWVATGVGSGSDSWHFMYDAAWVTDAYKWKFIGGAPVVLKEDGTVTFTSNAYQLPAAGTGTPANTQFLAVRAGVYGAFHQGDLNGTSGVAMSIGLSFAGGNQNITMVYGNAAEYRPFSGEGAPAAVAAGSSIAPIYAQASGSATNNIQHRQLRVFPVRII